MTNSDLNVQQYSIDFFLHILCITECFKINFSLTKSFFKFLKVTTRLINQQKTVEIAKLICHIFTVNLQFHISDINIKTNKFLGIEKYYSKLKLLQN